VRLYFKDIEQTGTEIDTDFSFSFEDGRFDSVRFSGSIYPVNEDKTEFYLRGTVTAKAVLPCDRCLEEVILELSGDTGISIVMGKKGELPEELELEESDIAVYETDEESLELQPLIEQEALLLLPMKVTCPEPCGNEFIAEEEQEKEADPRWEALKKLNEDK
jgi:uncharacterized protein